MKIEHLAGRLEQVGLTSEEAAVYLRLLRTGPVKAGTLSSYFDMSRSKIYRVLDGMAQKNVVSKSLERPTLYEAEDPETVICDRIERLCQRQQRLQELLETTLDPLRKVQASVEEEIEYYWSRVEGSPQIFDSFREAVTRSDKRVWWASTSELSLRLELPMIDKVWKVLSAAREGGCDTRLLFGLPEGRFEDVPTWLTRDMLDIRTVDHGLSPVDFGMLDQEVFLWARTTETVTGEPSDAVVLRTNAPGVRRPLQLLFEQLWTGGDEV